MPGWNLKNGDLVKEKVSEDELWGLFNFVFSSGSKKRNTYKFGFLKAILDNLFNGSWNNDLCMLSYDVLFSKFAENYWNIIVKYNLKQQRRDDKSEYSRIEKIFKDAVSSNSIIANVEFECLDLELKTSIIKKVRSSCKSNVVGALYNDLEGKVYSFDLNDEGIKLSRSSYDFMFRYKSELEKLNYYAWAQFMEKINDDSVLVRVLDKLELSTPRRNDLSIYREILRKEFEEDNCFYCGKKLGNGIHVDHFIPWSFIKEDKTWNFVLSCPSCNIKKKDRLASVDYIVRLVDRNEELKTSADVIVKRDFVGYDSNLLERMYLYAKLSGLKELKKQCE